MNLNELEITRKLKKMPRGTDTGAHLADIVYAHGWTLLGKGAEAAVAEHPQKGYVLKIWPINSLYTKFVRMVQKYPNPHFPQFSKVMKPIPGTKFSYVRMEKLVKVTQYDILVDMPECFCAIKDIYLQSNQALPYWIEANMADIRCPTLTPMAKQAVKLISAQMKKIGPRLDLHPGNIMRRGHTWVITDPYY